MKRHIIIMIGGFADIADGLIAILSLGYKQSNISGYWVSKHFFDYCQPNKSNKSIDKNDENDDSVDFISNMY